MSKYKKQGDYHYRCFNTQGDPYRLHVLDVVKHAEELLDPEASILDVGCGEGLITNRLICCKSAFKATGIDTDPDAIRLGKAHSNPVSLNTIDDINPGNRYDAVMMLDVLEHVEDFAGTLARAVIIADTIFIAVPDRDDPGALRQMIAGDVIDSFDAQRYDWDCLQSNRRHARDFMIFKRKAA